jgi:hypothetical protein
MAVRVWLYPASSARGSMLALPSVKVFSLLLKRFTEAMKASGETKFEQQRIAWPSACL